MSRSYELPDAILLQAQVDEAEVIIDKLEEENKKVTEYKELARLQADTITRLERENKKLREALKLTINTAEYVYQPNKPLEKGLPPFHYHTLTYEGDLELIEKTKAARKLLDSIKE